MTRLSNSEFLSSLTELLSKSNGESSVYFTQKRLTPVKSNLKVESEKILLVTEPVADETKYPILIRITDGKKAKYSTTVQVEQLDEFWLQYTNVLKNGVSGLRKKEKKKSKKKKVTKN